ncbi:hypothetical protein M2138_000980 [Dysgonomonadaceae bacterium PH5-43]|nr:hypothetical protein [Dysgonomonadaceae bacterium PH5-43]
MVVFILISNSKTLTTMKYFNIKLQNKAKVISLLAVFVFCCSSVFSQTANTEYFMQSSYTKTNLNPALRPDRGHIGIPGLSNIYVDFKTNTFNLDHFMFKGVGENGKTGTFLHQNVSYSDFMDGVSKNNYLGSEVSVSVIDFGFYTGDMYFTFDASVRTSFSANIPDDVFGFVKKGVTLTNDTGDNYDFSNVSAEANSFLQLGLGASKPIMDDALMLGAKVKFLMGIANAKFKLEKMNLNVGRDEWTLESKAKMQVIYHDVSPTYDDDDCFDGADLGSGFAFSGYGLGFDLGAVFEPGKVFNFYDGNDFLNNFKVSASLTDIGFISWKKQGMYLETDPSRVNITGQHNISFDDDSDNSLDNILDDIEDDFRDAVNLKDADINNLKTTTGLRVKMNWGVEYEVLYNKLNVGLLSSTYFTPNKNITEVTLGSSYKPIKWIELGLSYSFIYSKYKTFGCAIHFNPGHAINLFVASDYVIPRWNSDFVPTTSRGLNFQFGLAVGLGKMNPKYTK